MTVPGVSSELELEDFGVRFRVYPTRIQQQVLKRWIGTQRYIYNRKVEELEYQLRLKAMSKFSNRFEAPGGGTCPEGSIVCQVQTFGSVDDRNPQFRAPQQLQPV